MLLVVLFCVMGTLAFAQSGAYLPNEDVVTLDTVLPLLGAENEAPHADVELLDPLDERYVFTGITNQVLIKYRLLPGSTAPFEPVISGANWMTNIRTVQDSGDTFTILFDAGNNIGKATVTISAPSDVTYNFRTFNPTTMADETATNQISIAFSTSNRTVDQIEATGGVRVTCKENHPENDPMLCPVGQWTLIGTYTMSDGAGGYVKGLDALISHAIKDCDSDLTLNYGVCKLNLSNNGQQSSHERKVYIYPLEPASGVGYMDFGSSLTFAYGNKNRFYVKFYDPQLAYQDCRLEYAEPYHGHNLADDNFEINLDREYLQLIAFGKIVLSDGERTTLSEVQIPSHLIKWTTTNWNNVKVASGWIHTKKIVGEETVKATVENALFEKGMDSVKVRPDLQGIEIVNANELKNTLPGDEVLLKLYTNNLGYIVNNPIEWTTSDWNACSIIKWNRRIDPETGATYYTATARRKNYNPFTITASVPGTDFSTSVEVGAVERTLTFATVDSEYQIVNNTIECPVGTEIKIVATPDKGAITSGLSWASSSWNDAKVVGTLDSGWITVKNIHDTVITVTDTVGG